MDDAQQNLGKKQLVGEAKSYMEPTTEKDEYGEVIRSEFTLMEKLYISLLKEKIIKVFFFLDMKDGNLNITQHPTGLKYIDHMVGNVGWNQMDKWVKYYEDVMGFVNFLSFDDKQITTEYSGLMSKVMKRGNGRIKFPINEPGR